MWTLGKRESTKSRGSVNDSFLVVAPREVVMPGPQRGPRLCHRRNPHPADFHFILTCPEKIKILFIK